MDQFFFLLIFLGLSPFSFPAFRTSEASSYPDLDPFIMIDHLVGRKTVPTVVANLRYFTGILGWVEKLKSPAIT